MFLVTYIYIHIYKSSIANIIHTLKQYKVSRKVHKKTSNKFNVSRFSLHQKWKTFACLKIANLISDISKRFPFLMKRKSRNVKLVASFFLRTFLDTLYIYIYIYIHRQKVSVFHLISSFRYYQLASVSPGT